MSQLNRKVNWNQVVVVPEQYQDSLWYKMGERNSYARTSYTEVPSLPSHSSFKSITTSTSLENKATNRGLTIAGSKSNITTPKTLPYSINEECETSRPANNCSFFCNGQNGQESKLRSVPSTHSLIDSLANFE